MGRIVVVAVVLLSAIGCRNRPTQLDPFLGATKVPAPATGSIGAPGTAPAMLPPPSSVYTPPGGFVPNTSPASSSTAPASSSSSTPAQFAGKSSTPPPSSGVVNSGQSIRIVEPPPGTRPSTPAQPASRAGLFTGAASGGVDILDLPVSSRTAQPKTAEGARGVQQSYTSGGTSAGLDTSKAQVVTLQGQEPAYGFDAAYSQLNGRLEYSPADGRWLLRYITPGERADRLGGVVVLTPNSPVSGLRNGEMVTLRGRMENDGGGQMMPLYSATSVVPQKR